MGSINKAKNKIQETKMMGHDFSRQITEKCGTKYGNGNYILGHPKWKWELYFGTPKMEMGTIFWDTQNGNGNYMLGRREYITKNC